MSLIEAQYVGSSWQLTCTDDNFVVIGSFALPAHLYRRLLAVVVRADRKIFDLKLSWAFELDSTAIACQRQRSKLFLLCYSYECGVMAVLAPNEVDTEEAALINSNVEAMLSFLFALETPEFRFDRFEYSAAEENNGPGWHIASVINV